MIGYWPFDSQDPVTHTTPDLSSLEGIPLTENLPTGGSRPLYVPNGGRYGVRFWDCLCGKIMGHSNHFVGRILFQWNHQPVFNSGPITYPKSICQQYHWIRSYPRLLGQVTLYVEIPLEIGRRCFASLRPIYTGDL